MCYACWEKSGEPTIVNELTTSVAKMIDHVYDFSEVGGNAHIVVDDFNLEDDNIDFCLQQIKKNPFHDEKEQLDAEKQCLLALRQMSRDERASAMAIHEGYLTAELI